MNVILNKGLNINYNGAKAKALRYVKKNADKRITLQDIYVGRKRFNAAYNDLLKCDDLEMIKAAKKKLDTLAKMPGADKTKLFDFTYDKFIKEYKTPSVNSKVIKVLENYIEIIKSLINKKEKEQITCDFFQEKLKIEENRERDIFKKVMARCFSDLDEALLADAPQSKIDKLAKIIETFALKYGHLA